MAKFEKYLRLDPSGDLSWITIDRDHFLHDLYEAIGCNDLEHVTLSFGFGCVVDGCGKIKSNPQPVNHLASRLYPGALFGDPLVGPVIFVRTDLVDGEPDWFPLLPSDLCCLERLLQVTVPPSVSEIHPCICGAIPKLVRERKTYGHGEYPLLAALECECGLKSKSFIIDGFYGSTTTVDDLIVWWNERFPAASNPEV